MDIITERIVRLREENNISKAKMSEMLGLDPSNYSKYEKNGKDWTISQIQQIAKVLGVSVGDILKIADDTDKEVIKQLLKRVKELERMVALYEDKFDLMKTRAKTRIRELAQIQFIIDDIYNNDGIQNLPLPENIYDLTERIWGDGEAYTYGLLGLIEDEVLKQQFNKYYENSSVISLEDVLLTRERDLKRQISERYLKEKENSKNSD